MSQVYQRVMSDGDWELNLDPDTPRAILDKLAPWTCHVVICPGEIDVTSDDATMLAASRYVGVVRRLGRNRLNPGGPGNAMWLSDPDGKGEIIKTKITQTSASLSTWVSALLPSSLSAGTVTSPGGTFSNSYQYVSRRDALNSVCRAFAVEWRVNNDFTVDVGEVGDLYNTTPRAVVARAFGGRDAQVVGIRANLDTSIDWEEYTSEAIVIGNGVGTSGGLAPFRKPAGTLITWSRVVEDPQAPAGSLSAVAGSVLDLLQSDIGGRVELRVATDLYDVSGDVGLGDNVAVWDPENGIKSIVVTSSQMHYQGQLIFPKTFRCIGMRWPVRRGMGVYLRIQNNTGTPTYENITPYVEFSEGAAELELGAASRLLRSDTAGQISEVTGQVKQAPWLTYTPTWSSTGTQPAIGNGTRAGAYRREGTTLHLRGYLTMGSTTTYGTGEWRISLPSGMTAVTSASSVFQIMAGGVTDASAGGAGSSIVPIVQSAGTVIRLLVNLSTSVTGTSPVTFANGDTIFWNGTLEVDP